MRARPLLFGLGPQPVDVGAVDGLVLVECALCERGEVTGFS